ncbi:MAG: SIS domain-containing protein, partial [Acidobacteriota bacterium]
MAAPDLQQTILDNETQRLARAVMEAEARAIQMAAVKVDTAMGDAVDCLRSCSGKVIVTGMGKSGHVARKLAATLQSTGTPAVFLHPSEAAHG